MTARRPLVRISGRTKELPSGDTLTPGLTPLPDVQEFLTPGSYTWTKPAGARWVEVWVHGGGGGGGSGRRGAAGTVRCGGGGGTRGQLTQYRYAAADLGASESVVVGAGGAGASGATTDGTDGAVGTAGGSSSFGSFITAPGGPGGLAGTAVNATAYNLVIDILSGGGFATSLWGGGAPPTANTGLAGAGGSFACGGSGGSGLNTTNLALAGPSGINCLPLTGTPSQTPPAGGAVGGGAGADGSVGAAPWHLMSTSGAGGGSSTTSAGGAGGAGGRGSGGGGGAGSLNGFSSGAGGAGGDGWVRITTYF